MSALLLNRSLGAIKPFELQRSETTRQLYAIQPANVYFKGQNTSSITKEQGIQRRDHNNDDDEPIPAHPAGVNTIAIDRFEGKYLLSGGADSSIAIWDLEDNNNAHSTKHNSTTTTTLHHPAGHVHRSTPTHKPGITHLSFYAFDSAAFLSSSYDHTLKIYDAEALTPSASFNLEAAVYSHAMSPIGTHLTVACATQHPAIRLVDLRSAACSHALAAGHSAGAAVLSLAWCPVAEHTLASAGADGTIRFWDIRRSAAALAVLDMHDSQGVVGGGSSPNRTRTRNPIHARAHLGPANGICWTDDGQHLISVGHDDRIRVWDVRRGANTLVNFGPLVRNNSNAGGGRSSATLLPLLSPPSLTPAGKELLFYPNPNEILVFDLFEGELVKRLRVSSSSSMLSSGREMGMGRGGLMGMRKKGGLGGIGGIGVEQARRSRTTALAWKYHDVGFYSAHADGSIRAWMPRSSADAEADEEEEWGEEGEGGSGGGGGGGGNWNGKGNGKRKADVLDDIVEGLTRRTVTFA
ncbi:WD40 repeat-like protein [Pseudovirgaria hyperparasitica]|uniref:WD40 repeat-like protein n=1 Tax=Pseudovirgaria hyperparasitica TaxID=470096 RepID=A0A6A6W8T3_9PEZI|nr:WD40 repeat-like protein [Pseudovirgaria hyperparasitica]KAF2759262.1 WD40 repeat-like protein [Pseudovirgaria hyperparasitica]